MREFMGFMADSKIAAPPGGRDVLHKYVRAPKVLYLILRCVSNDLQNLPIPMPAGDSKRKVSV